MCLSVYSGAVSTGGGKDSTVSVLLQTGILLLLFLALINTKAFFFQNFGFERNHEATSLLNNLNKLELFKTSYVLILLLRDTSTSR